MVSAEKGESLGESRASRKGDALRTVSLCGEFCCVLEGWYRVFATLCPRDLSFEKYCILCLCTLFSGPSQLPLA